MSMLKACFAAFLGLVALTASTGAFAESKITADQKKQIEKIIENFLLENPDVLTKALINAQRQQEADRAAALKDRIKENKELIFNSKNQIVLGNPKGDITLVEFFDYNCGYCKQALNTVKKLLAEDKNLRVVMKEFPILGRQSQEASLVSLAAYRQDPKKFSEFHIKLMSTRGRSGKKKALAVAGAVGYDVAKLEADLNNPKSGDVLTESNQIASQLGIQGTPAFIIGDVIIPGFVEYDALKTLTANFRKCGKATCS